MDESVTGSVNPFSGEGAARTTGVDHLNVSARKTLYLRSSCSLIERPQGLFGPWQGFIS
jgi:hypothetical protein